MELKALKSHNVLQFLSALTKRGYVCQKKKLIVQKVIIIMG